MSEHERPGPSARATATLGGMLFWNRTRASGISPPAAISRRVVSMVESTRLRVAGGRLQKGLGCRDAPLKLLVPEAGATPLFPRGLREERLRQAGRVVPPARLMELGC
ncbi:hypothetical protein LX36DRAFT_657641 [Colletotrichum falcatum]|nr:hypothetical protein LX36DRAFT_657641 [Colletotrichum falcatum]